MRRNLFAALLASTFLTAPSKAEALPVVGFLAGAFSGGGGFALMFPGMVGGGFVAGVSFAASGLGSLVLRSVISFGLSKLAEDLTRSNSNPAAQAQAQARLTNYAQPITPVEYVFGKVRKGGPLGFTGFANNKRFYAPILAAHRCQGVVEHWMDEEKVSISGSSITSGNPNDLGSIYFKRGSSTQPVVSVLEDNFSEITSAHNFKGLCYAVCSAARPDAAASFSERYPTGRQWVYSPVIEGWDEIWDPRDNTHKYTNNAALVIAKWATSILGTTVNWDEVADEANACDVTVTNKQSVSQPKWTLNGILSDDQDYETQRAQLAVACDAFIYERADGGIGFKVGRWIEPTVNLTAADFYEFEDSSGDWGSNVPNEIACEYIDPDNDWKETVSGAWVEDASSKRIRDVLQTYMVNSHNQAARIAKRVAKVKHAPSKITATMGIIGAELIGQRFFRVIHDESGTDTTYEVGELSRDGSVWRVTAVEATEADFNFNAATEEPEKNEYSSVESTDTVDNIGGVTVVAIEGAAIKINWAAADASLTQQIQLCDGSGLNCQIYDVPTGQRPFQITGLTDGSTYRVRVRNKTIALRVSDWKPDTAVEVDAVQNLVAPALVTDIDLTEDSGDILVDYITPNDANYAGAQIYRADYASAYAGPFSFVDASLVATGYGAANSAQQFLDGSPSAGVYAYWIKSINSSGTASGPTAVETIEIT